MRSHILQEAKKLYVKRGGKGQDFSRELVKDVQKDIARAEQKVVRGLQEAVASLAKELRGL